MGALEFFVDVVYAGTVLGAEPGIGPDAVGAIMGTDFAENRGQDEMWRDFGLVEFFWERPSGHDGWQGRHFTVQVHRLESAGAGVVGETIRRAYGSFGHTPAFEELRSALDKRGAPLMERPGTSPGAREYWQPESHMSVLVLDDEQAGTVHSISGPVSPDVVAAWEHRRQATALQQALDQLVRASEPERARWLARRQPGERERANWWLHLLLRIGARSEELAAARTDWVLLYLWALRQAQEQQALTPVETAARTAYFVARLHRDGLTDELAERLPAPDDLVRTCLDLIPLTLTQAAAPYRLATLERAAMLRSRRARQLTTAAASLAGLVRDEELADGLRRWITLRPHLV